MKRNWSTLSWITTQNSKRLSGRRPASSQTGTSSLPFTLVSVQSVPAGLTQTSARTCTPMSCSFTEKLCCSWCRLRHRAQIYCGKRQGEKPPSSQTETSWLLAPNVAVTRKCRSRQLNVDIRKNLHANVVLSGGTTIFQGIWANMTLHSRCIS